MAEPEESGGGGGGGRVAGRAGAPGNWKGLVAVGRTNAAAFGFIGRPDMGISVLRVA